MFKKMILICIGCLAVISLSGCATAGKQKDLQIQGLRNQVTLLESQIQSRDEEINNLRNTITGLQQEKDGFRSISPRARCAKGEAESKVKCRPKVKHIQIALKNAGFNPGNIDGNMGQKTTEAIKAFQKAHKLPVDGKVGKKTWDLLRNYLYQKVK